MQNIIIKSIQSLRQPDSLLELSRKNRSPVYITKNGENHSVFLAQEVYNELMKELELLRVAVRVNRSIEGVKAGEYIPHEKMMEEIDKM